ncbi:hypothetical protein [Nocardia sp. NPDC057227]
MIDQPVLTPLLPMLGRCDTDGAEAVVDLVLAVNRGVYGDIFAAR